MGRDHRQDGGGSIDAALDRLGVGEDDAEWLVLEGRGPACSAASEVSARLRVGCARPRLDPRSTADRKRRSGSDASAPASTNGNGSTTEASGRSATKTPRATTEASSEQPPAKRPSREETPVSDPAQLEREREIATEFVDGLVSAFGLDGEVATTMDDDEIEVGVEGDDLGLLIGPRSDVGRSAGAHGLSCIERCPSVPAGFASMCRAIASAAREALERFTPSGRGRGRRIGRAADARAHGRRRSQDRSRCRPEHRGCHDPVRGRGSRIVVW